MPPLSILFHFFIFYCAFLISAYWHLQYFSSVYLTLSSSFTHIDICSISVLNIWLWLPYLCILTSAVFQINIFYFAFPVSAYWHLQYFSSAYLTLLSSSFHIDICRISVLYTSHCFPPLWILASALFQSFIFYFSFLVSANWHLQFFSSVYFTLLSSSLHISICSISVLYISLFCLRVCILASALFQFCVIYFVFLAFPCWYSQCYSSIEFTLIFSSLYIDIWSIIVLYILFCFLCQWILISPIFQFCIFYFVFFLCAYWDLQCFTSVYFTLLWFCPHINIYSD